MNIDKALQVLKEYESRSVGGYVYFDLINDILEAMREPKPKELKIGGYQELALRIRDINTRLGELEAKLGSKNPKKEIMLQIEFLRQDIKGLEHRLDCELVERAKNAQSEKTEPEHCTCDVSGMRMNESEPCQYCNKKFKKPSEKTKEECELPAINDNTITPQALNKVRESLKHTKLLSEEECFGKPSPEDKESVEERIRMILDKYRQEAFTFRRDEYVINIMSILSARREEVDYKFVFRKILSELTRMRNNTALSEYTRQRYEELISICNKIESECKFNAQERK